MMFSVRVTDYQDNRMLNICDADLLELDVSGGDLTLNISRSYYGGRTVGRAEAEQLLKSSSIINMAGEQTVSLSVGLGVGSQSGVRRIGGVPFLIVFNM